MAQTPEERFLGAFEEGTFEIVARDLEVDFDKQLVVVEQIFIGKVVEERTETIQETARRVEVDVEEIPGRGRAEGFVETKTIDARGQET